MNTNQPSDPIKDLAEIRSIMERSTRILSLSGLAGISVGMVALCGAALFLWLQSNAAPDQLRRDGILLALGVLLLSITFAVLFSRRMARRQGLPTWNQPAKFLITELAIPMAAGGVMCAGLLLHEAYFLLPSTMLTFYGLALVNASKFAVREVRWLGLTQILLGLLAAFLPQWGLALWAAGFGGVHILYGMRIFTSYEK
jgi:hypothetical protein